MTHARVDTPHPAPPAGFLADLAPSARPFIVEGPDTATVFRLARDIRARLAAGPRPGEPAPGSPWRFSPPTASSSPPPSWPPPTAAPC
jgi:hypothetical protein